MQDSFLTDTAEYADVVLPRRRQHEDEGTFTNGERFVQRVRPAAPPLGEALPDWKIVQLLANALGGDWAYAGPADVMREIAEVVWCYRGIAYERLDDEGLQSPCPGVDRPGTAILHVTEFSRGKAAFAPVETGVAATAVDADFPLVLLTGCVREHHGTGVRSRRSAGSDQPGRRSQAGDQPGGRSEPRYRGRRPRQGGRPDCGGDRGRRSGHRARARGVVFLPGFSATAPVARLCEWGASGHAGGPDRAESLRQHKRGARGLPPLAPRQRRTVFLYSFGPSAAASPCPVAFFFLRSPSRAFSVR